MTDKVIAPSRWKTRIACVVGLLGTGLVIARLSRESDVSLDHQETVVLMIAMVAFAYAFFTSGKCIRFRREAFEVRDRFGRSSYTLWSDVDQIGIAAFPSTAGGKLSYRYLLGVRLRDDVRRAQETGARANREACGYDVLFEPNYGLSLERLVTLMNERKRDQQGANQAPQHNAGSGPSSGDTPASETPFSRGPRG